MSHVDIAPLNKRNPAYRIAILIAILGAGLLVYWQSIARPLWVDEEMLLLNVRDRGFAQLTGPLWLDQSAPLGWLALERVVLLTFGSGERAVRLVTVLFGVAMLVTGVWIGRRWMSPFGASVLVLLCAMGQWIVFFTLELKHYSADTFWALFLPALGAWAIEGVAATTTTDAAARGIDEGQRRIALWWLAAIVGQFFGNGALFVAPACAVVLLVESWRRGGWRAASWTVVGGCGWLASFALVYMLVLRHALGNASLQNYWEFAFPPASAGVGGTIQWAIGRLAPFAIKPVGSGFWTLFWIVSGAGFLFAIVTRRPVGLMFLTVPFSALALALLRFVPPFERLALWVVPSLYVAVGFSADAALSFARRGVPGPRPLRLVVAAALAVATMLVGLDIVERGQRELRVRPRSNYGLDDRSSIRWLMSATRPGDVVMTTHFGLAALWWYGGLNVSEADRSGSLPDGTPILEVGHAPPRECRRRDAELDAVLSGYSRAVVYLGFRLNVLPRGFDRLVLNELTRRGLMVGYQPYVEESRLAIFDLRQASRGPLVLPVKPGENLEDMPPAPVGCLSIRPARRW